MTETDFLIVGAGIIGLAIAKELSERFQDAKITIVEKEKEAASHASGRNSGVLHAGFYYPSDTLKARFTVEGNKLLTGYCLEHGISINRCGKVVVARNEEELNSISELKRRGDTNGVSLQVIDKKELKELEPNAKTYEKALYSPNTSTVNPKEVCRHIEKALENKVRIIYENPLLKVQKDVVIAKKGKIKYRHLVNCAGLYADKVAHQFGAGLRYTMLPFKGMYLKYEDDLLIKMLIYPIPNLNYPFLGVHFTKAVDGKVMIGPTAVPALWRENYSGFENFRLNEFFAILYHESRLLLSNAFNFRGLSFREMKKHYKKYILKQAGFLVKEFETNRFGRYISSGIRAQLLDKESSTLVMDFVVESGEKSTHVLNAVSPAFTCSFVFAKYVVDIINHTCPEQEIPEAEHLINTMNRRILRY